MPKKILMLCRLYHPHVGGIETHVASLIPILQSRGYSVTVLTEQYDPNVPIFQTHNDTHIYRIPNSFIGKKIATWKFISKSLLNPKHPLNYRNFDQIHIHDILWWLYPFLGKNSLRNRITITFHGYEGVNSPSINAILQRRLNTHLVNGSLAIGQFMQQWYGVKSDFVSYGAVDESLDGQIKTIKWHQKKPIKAMYAGRLEADVGIMTYLTTVKFLIEHNINLELTVFGEGSQASEAKGFSTKHALPVVFKSFTPKVSSQLPYFDLAFCSRYLGILEAMKSRTLVVAVYNNQIKYDYLACHPQVSSIILGSSDEEIGAQIINLDQRRQHQMLETAGYWADQQSWGKLATIYESLWHHEAH